MKADFYYNYKYLGDVLLIVINNDLIPNHYIKDNDIVLIYNNDTLIGINFFNISLVCKIKGKGQINFIPDVLLQIINNRLEKYQIILEENNVFLVGKIISFNNNIAEIDIKDNILEVACENAEINKLCVIKINTKEQHICSFNDLNISSSNEIFYLDEEVEIGQNFYISKGGQ